MASIVTGKQLLKASDHIFVWGLVVPHTVRQVQWGSKLITSCPNTIKYMSHFQRNHLVIQDCLQYRGCCAAEKNASKTLLGYFETFLSSSQETSTSLIEAVYHIPYTYVSQRTDICRLEHYIMLKCINVGHFGIVLKKLSSKIILKYEIGKFKNISMYF
jgi:hypothetical protein